MTHHLLSADFSDGPGVFHTGSTEQFRFQVEDGAYVVTSLKAGANPGMTYGEFARVAWAIDSSVDVVNAASLPGDTEVGVGCIDESGKLGFMLFSRVDGTEGYVMVLTGSDGARRLFTWGRSVSGGPVRNLHLSSYIDSPLGGRVTLIAEVNGVRAPKTGTWKDFKGCAGMVLAFGTNEKGVSVGFDNALATVPGE